MPKHSKYSSELEDLLDLYAGYVVDWANGYTSDNKYEAKRTETLAKITALVTKEKDKAELAARFKYEPAIAHAIGYCRGLGHPESYLEKQFPELAQLAKDKEDGNG